MREETETISDRGVDDIPLGSLSTCVFETRTATGSEPFSLLICPQTTTFTLLSIFSPLATRRKKFGRKCGPSTRNVLFQLPSASQKRAYLTSERSTVTVEWFEKFSLNFSISLFVIRVDLFHP